MTPPTFTPYLRTSVPPQEPPREAPTVVVRTVPVPDRGVELEVAIELDADELADQR